MVFCPGASISQLQENKLRGQDGPLDLGLRQCLAVRQIALIEERLIEERVGEDGVHERFGTPYR
jgi:hypothetical protein